MKISQEDDIEILKDLDDKGRERPWSSKKMQNEQLSTIYSAFDTKKAERLLGCASFLGYQKVDNKFKLKTANFCRVRLCPVCIWRRSLKLFSQMQRILIECQKQYAYKYLFVTLTVQNVDGQALSSTIDKLMVGVNRLLKYKAVDGVAEGYLRTMEITHDMNYLITPHMYKKSKDFYDRQGFEVGMINPNFNMYHPHFHLLIAVKKSYFKDKKKYINQEVWTDMWRKAMKLDYTPVVNVKRVKSQNGETDAESVIKAVCEVSKYSVKPDDFIMPDDFELSLETVQILDKALESRRFVGFGKLFKDIHKQLNLSDAEDDANLINVSEDDEPIVDLPKDDEVFYSWSSGYKQYRKE